MRNRRFDNATTLGSISRSGPGARRRLALAAAAARLAEYPRDSRRNNAVDLQVFFHSRVQPQDPVLIRGDGETVDGHHRLKASRAPILLLSNGHNGRLDAIVDENWLRR